MFGNTTQANSRSRVAAFGAAALAAFMLATMACGTSEPAAAKAEPTSAPPAAAPAPQPTATPMATATVVPKVKSQLPTAVAVVERASEDTPVEQELLVVFMDHMEAARMGDYQEFLDGCLSSTRDATTPGEIGARIRNQFDAYDFTPEGFSIVGASAQVLDPITGIVVGNTAEFGVIQTLYNQGQDQAWMWTTENDRWVDVGCSVVGG